MIRQHNTKYGPRAFVLFGNVKKKKNTACFALSTREFIAWHGVCHGCRHSTCYNQKYLTPFVRHISPASFTGACGCVLVCVTIPWNKQSRDCHWKHLLFKHPPPAMLACWDKKQKNKNKKCHDTRRGRQLEEGETFLLFSLHWLPRCIVCYKTLYVCHTVYQAGKIRNFPHLK